MLLITVISVGLVEADEVNLDIDVNGTANLNISIDTEDTELREDVYGTEGNSPAEDVILQYIEGQISDQEDSDGMSTQSGSDTTLDEMEDFCDDPAFADYFKTLSSVPPDAFIQHMKSLGYDDVGQITLIWTMCQDKYIEENEGKWSRDRDFDYDSLSHTIRDAIEWLLGIETSPSEEEVEIATSLDSYFASDKDASYLLRRVNDLTFRVEALENAMDDIASEAYCRGKQKVMLDYNLEGVRCDDTTWFNHQLSPTGEEMLIGITPVNGEEENGEIPEIPEEIPQEEDTEEVLASADIEEINLEENEGLNILALVNSRMNDLTRGLLLLVSSYTITLLVFFKGFPTKRGYGLKEMTSGVKVLGTFMMDKTLNAMNNVIAAMQSDRRREEKFIYSFGKGWFKA